jgi:hypothetical protein
MRVGDKLRCINNDKCSGLVMGKIYTVLAIDYEGDPRVFNTTGPHNYMYYFKSRFINITEERRKKLKKLNGLFMI